MKIRDYMRLTNLKEDMKEAELSEAGFEKYPKGWTRDSIESFAKSLGKEYGIEGGDKKGFFDACVKKIGPHMDNPEGFCAAVKDEVFGSTFWRGKGKTEKEAKAGKKNVPEKGK